MKRAVLSMLSSILLLCACGGSSGVATDAAAPPSNLSVEKTSVYKFGQPAARPSGGTISFLFTVLNDGTTEARNVPIRIDLGSNLALESVECSPRREVGTTCPTTLGQDMLVPRLPVHGQLQFTVNVTELRPASFDARVTMTLTAPADVDPRDDEAGFAIRIWRSDIAARWVAPASAAAGSTVRVELHVGNSGPDDADNLGYLSGATFPGAAEVKYLNCQDSPATPCHYAAWGEARIPVGTTAVHAYDIVLPASGLSSIVGRIALGTSFDPAPGDNAAEVEIAITAP